MFINFICTYNEADYVQYAINSMYDNVDKTIIIEGTFLETNSKDPRSTDGTIQLIDGIKDLSNKLIKIQMPYSLPQNQQRSIVFDIINKYGLYTNGECKILLQDADEVYHEKYINKISCLVNNWPDPYESIRINSYTFINDFWHYVDIKMPRLYKIRSDHRYRFYQPNDVCKTKIIEHGQNNACEIPNNGLRKSPRMPQDLSRWVTWTPTPYTPLAPANWALLPELEKPDIYFHHYSYVKSKERFLQKRAERIAQTGHFKWNIDQDGRIYSHGVNIKVFDEHHPELMKEHPRYTQNV